MACLEDSCLSEGNRKERAGKEGRHIDQGTHRSDQDHREQLSALRGRREALSSQQEAALAALALHSLLLVNKYFLLMDDKL